MYYSIPLEKVSKWFVVCGAFNVLYTHMEKEGENIGRTKTAARGVTDCIIGSAR